MTPMIGGPKDARAVAAWLLGTDTGASSCCIAAHMLGAAGDVDAWDRKAHPHDPGDLGRCLRLLALFPHWKAEFPSRMAKVSPAWRRLVKAWPQLEATMADEVGIDWSKGRKAPKTYTLMEKVLRK